MTDINYYLDLPYTKVLKRDDDGDIVATIAELDGCITHGSNDAEALQNLRDAQAAWIAAAIDAGQDIPPPEIEEELPSGRFVVRLPRSLHHKANKLAKKDDISLNQLVLMAISEHMARRESRDEMKPLIIDALAWRRTPAKWTGERSKTVDPETMPYLKAMQEKGGVALAPERDKHFGPRTRKARHGVSRVSSEP